MLEALRWIRSDIALAGADSEKGSELVASKRLLSVFNRIGMYGLRASMIRARRPS
jgi:hypothetical protein